MTDLTICIPTYNRNELLLETLSKLLPQITDEKLVIVDNASDVPVENTIAPLLKSYPDANVTVYRNRVNIGICGNFLRCFEYCQTQWMWFLSDDDTPIPDALEMIAGDIADHSDYTFINYASKEMLVTAGTNRDEDIHSVGLAEFIRKMDVFSNVIFVSAGVYNINKLIEHLRIGYLYSYSLVPHLAIVMYSLGENGKVLMSHKEPVIFNQPTSTNTWSRLLYTQGVNLVMEMPLQIDDESYRILFNKINFWLLSDYEILQQVKSNYGYSNLKQRYIFVQIMARLLFKARSRKEKIKVLKSLIKLYYPKLDPEKTDPNDKNVKPLLHRI